jgi:hypothetical protein
MDFIVTTIGRGERIRTSGFCVPNAALYQAELHPVSNKLSRLPVVPGNAVLFYQGLQVF